MARIKITLEKNEIEKAMEGKTKWSEVAEELRVGLDVLRRERKRHGIFNLNEEGAETFLQEYGKAKSIKELTERLGMTRDAVFKKIMDIGLDEVANSITSRIAKFEHDTPTPEQFFAELKSLDSENKSIGYEYFEYKFGKRIGIVFLGDLHLGNETTDYNKIAEVVQTIKNTPNLFCIFLGDYVDNFGKYSVGAGLHQQVINASIQKIIIEWIANYLGDKILGVIQGCHDEWSYRDDAFDLGKYLSNQAGSAYLGFDGVLGLNVGKNLYRIYCCHKTRFHSNINQCHGIKQTRRLQEDFDIGVNAHWHCANSEWFLVDNQIVLAIQISSFKRTDRYIDAMKFPRFEPVIQGVILEPKDLPSYEYRGIKRKKTWLGISHYMDLDALIRDL